QDVAASPVFLVMTTRPGFSPPWPAGAAVTQLHLGRLEAKAIDAVIGHACAERALSPAERAAIAARCGGVPPFAEELVRAAGARRFEEATASAHRAALRALARHARVEARELLRQALSWLEQLPGSEARERSEIGLRMQLGAVLIATEGYTSAELERSSRRME